MNARTWVIALIVVAVVVALAIVGTRPPAPAYPPAPTGQAYTSKAMGFSLQLPAGYSVYESYSYQELGPGKDIAGVKFTIPASVATGTNLGADSYLSIEEIPNVQSCTASLFLDQQGGTSVARTVTDVGVTYSVATSTGAAAGNRYEETVYALAGTNPCRAVRYFVHYGVFQNYAPGMVREFDKQALLAAFDAIRRTLVITQ